MMPTSSIHNQLASALGRSDESPNIALAQSIAATHDTTAIAELIDLLDHPDQNIRSDALKVLYETGKIDPTLIAGYGERFVQLLDDRHNRMVWGGMEALAGVADVDPAPLLPHLEKIIDSTTTGSVITRDWGVRVLTTLALADASSKPRITSVLFDLLHTCKPSEFPRHAESMTPLLITDPSLASAFRDLAAGRHPTLSPPQAKRINKVLASL